MAYQVDLLLADKDKNVFSTVQEPCFGNLFTYTSQDKTEYIGYKPHFQLTTEGDRFYYDWIRTLWDFPKLWSNIDADAFNKGAVFLINVNDYNLWQIYNHFTLIRYLDPGDQHPNFGQHFKEFADKLVHPEGLNLAQVFVLTDLYGEPLYWGGHGFYCRMHFRMGNIEAIKSGETFRSGWPDFPPAKQGRDWRGRFTANGYYHGLLVPQSHEFAMDTKLTQIETLKMLFPTKWEFVHERLNK